MAERILSAEVEINVSKATQNLDALAKKVEQAADAVESSADKTVAASQKIGQDATGAYLRAKKAVEDLAKKTTESSDTVVRELAKEAIAADKVGDRLQASSNRAGTALTNLNRVIQDAPFGFVAIQNNIDPLLSSFQALAKESGGVGAATKALFSTLAGPVGILFAVSAVTSAITALTQKYGSLGNAYNVLTGQTQQLTEEQKRYAEEAQKSAIGVERQRVETEALVKVARGDVGTKQQQIDALAKLNQAIPDNIGYLTQQNIKTEEGTRILAAYTKQLIDTAEAELLSSQAAELRVKLREQGKTLDQEVTKEIQKATKAQQQLGAGTSVAGALSGVNAITKAVNIDRDAVINGSKAFQEYVANANKLAEITNRINELTPGTINSPKVSGGKGLKASDIFDPSLNPLNKLYFTPEIVLTPGGFEIQTGLKKLNQLVQQNIDTTAATRTFIIPSKIIIKPEKLNETVQNLNKQLNAAIANFSTDAFAGIGELIGNAISGGTNGIQDAARGLGNLFGNFLKQLGRILIESSIQIQAAKIALKSFNPALTLAAGIALSAIGSIVTTKLSATKFANGGIVTGPTFGLIGEAGQPEVILPLSKINQFLDQGNGGGGKLQAVVTGDALTFILNRTDRRQARNF